VTNYSQAPAGGGTKIERQRALLKLIKNEALSTQGELVDKLTDLGFTCTQVSISRDIRDLGLVKQNGRYTVRESGLPADTLTELSDKISGFIKSTALVGDNLIVIKTLPGTAHSVGLLIDNVNWSHIEGTVAGDDTVFVAVSGGITGCKSVSSNLNQLTKKGR